MLCALFAAAPNSSAFAGQQQTDAPAGYTATALHKLSADAQVVANVGYFGQGNVPPSLIANVVQQDREHADKQTASAQIAPAESLSPAEIQLPASGQFALVAGEPLEAQLFAWAKRAGWKVLWNLPEDNNWIVPGDQACGTNFETAVKQVIETLAANGIDIVGDSWRGNRTIVLSQSGATDQ
jgi:hypothetical protein